MSPVDFILEALDVPQPGWPGRTRYIAGQLLRLVVELVVFLLILAALFGSVLLVAAQLDFLP